MVDGDADGAEGARTPEASLSPIPDDFRTKYLRRLAYSNVLVPKAQRPPKHQTVIIFDWDDTLLCTTWLNRQRDRALPLAAVTCLEKMAKDVQHILDLAVQHGQTFIITNAQAGWVEHSVSKWAPQLMSSLRHVRIISARDQYEQMYPGEVDMWKTEAFLEVQRQLDCGIVTNLIALGDSDFEMKAAHVMGEQFEHALLKTVKFRGTPTPPELLKEVELVSRNFSKIVNAARNMKIVLERRVASGGQ